MSSFTAPTDGTELLNSRLSLSYVSTLSTGPRMDSLYLLRRIGSLTVIALLIAPVISAAIEPSLPFNPLIPSQRNHPSSPQFRNSSLDHHMLSKKRVQSFSSSSTRSTRFRDSFQNDSSGTSRCSGGCRRRRTPERVEPFYGIRNDSEKR